MKNLKRTQAKLCVGALIVFGFTSCEQKKEKNPVKEPAPTEISAPKQIVSVAQAKTMYDAYGERRVGLIEAYENELAPEKKFDVARFGYYDYNTIKEYMDYIEQEAKRANVEISSLRFYFSNYPDKKTFDDGREIKHPKQNSFFIIPALKENDREYGFYIREEDDGKNVPVLLTDNLEPKKEAGTDRSGESKSEASFMPTTSPAPFYGTNKSLVLNEAHMVPPPYHED
ncbi:MULTISPECIES: hypothetical protein [unclassified Arenibacter]|uniref:hypothetical protein n=1 Tax=unclassified Arenibacter TaxID=2615047 RepID=UPI000E341C22|nr:MULTISPECIES: hypothetical protein [unclassified Arenibacter]MCM4164521.1 hypothetical protein [Arenibacter sp. A80]RFT55606.1 hypothetical protein D0S24_13020 [Arenibacter sp. P308M17]